MSEYRAVPPGPAVNFNALQATLSAELIADDAVFELVLEARSLESAPTELPHFVLHVHYPSLDNSDSEQLGSEAPNTIGIGFMLENQGGSTTQNLPELSVGIKSYDYIRLGYMRIDGTEVWIFDESTSQLHQLPKGEDGLFLVSEKDEYDIRRVKAMLAWQKSHNKMIRAAKQDPSITLDPMTQTWTNQHPNYQIDNV